MSKRVTQVFLEARALSPEQRPAFLGKTCAHDPELRREVESLLEHDESAARLMPDSAPGRELAVLVPGVLDDLANLEAAPLPKRIGKYPILGLVGRGGMGLVYRSEQDHPRRPIALKVLRPEFVSPASQKRFQFEVEILGRLRHPGIAQIYEAGTFESELGPQPYFAMELIEGRPLSEHARALDLGARLELVASIADAVQYAHSQGVVHRDLKPGNILVDARGAAKVLDFGIARASDADLQATTLVTRGGELLGTLPYMSPEQLSGDSRAIDARSDVYALGVNLYQLLAGRLPFELGQRSLTAALAFLCDGEPERLGAHEPALRGDLETIVHKALAKEKERRYQTAAELALDLRRFLRHEPILARPAGPLYLFRKFTRRNRALVAAAGVALLALLLGFVATLVLYQREKAAATRALSLSTLQRLQELREEATGLWPHQYYRRGAMERWIQSGEGLARELPRLEGYLGELRAEGVQNGGGQWEFADDEQRWLHDSLARVFAEVSAFANPDPHLGLLAEMRARLEVVEDLVDETAGEHAAEWDSLLAVFADNPRYHGLALEPQHGLVPLRVDPRSGLWEFWDTQSGVRPELDPATDRWRILPETGLVLILVPGGTFRMGAQSGDPELPNFDTNRREDTVPIREVSVEPFFLSKYEVTQSQWHRFQGTNPDAPGDHPVVQVSWEDCTNRLGLPTEAQWEFAARAGTQDTWPFGHELELLARHANLKDQSFAQATGDAPGSLPWDDSFASLAPVGSFEPNPFGFHDLFGNAWEWCRDDYGSYELPVAGTDSERVVPDSEPNQGQRVFRGGSFRGNESDATPSARAHAPADSRRDVIGVRPSRMIWGM